MEKNDRTGPERTVEEKGLQVTNPETSQNERANLDNFQPNQQLEENSRDPTENETLKLDVKQEMAKFSPQKSFQDNKELEYAKSEQETVSNVIARQEFEMQVESSRVSLQNTSQANERTPQECNTFATSEQLETNINIKVQQIVESSGTKLNASIKDAGHDENTGLRKECDRIAENAPLEANATLPEKIEPSKNLFSLKSDEFCKASVDNGKAEKVQSVVTPQGNAAPSFVSETPPEPVTGEGEVSIRAQQLLKMMADFFKQHQKEFSYQEYLHYFGISSLSIETAKHDKNDAVEEECDRIVAKADQTEKVETPQDQSCEVSEDKSNVRKGQDVVIQHENLTPEVVSETQAETEARKDEVAVGSQELLKMMANISKQQQKELPRQESSHNFDSSRHVIETAKLGKKDAAPECDKIVTYTDQPGKIETPDDQSCEVSEDTIVTKRQNVVPQRGNGTPEVVSENQLESVTKEGEVSATAQQYRKMTAIFFHKWQLTKILQGDAVQWEVSEIPTNSGAREDKSQQTVPTHDSKNPQPSDGYVTFEEILRLLKDAEIDRKRKLKNYVPRESDDANIRAQNPQDDVTVQPEQQNGNARGLAPPLFEATESSNQTGHSSRPINEVGSTPEVVNCPLHFQETAFSPESDQVASQTQDMEIENGKNVFPPGLSRTPSHRARMLPSQSTTAPDVEDSPKTEESTVQRNGRISGARPHALPAGMLTCWRSIRERYISLRRRLVLYGLYFGLFLSVLFFGISVYVTIVYGFNTVDNLDNNESAFVTNFNSDVATPMNGFNFSATTPLNNFGVHHPLDDFDFAVTTPVDNFEVTFPFTDLTVTRVTPIKRYRFNISSLDNLHELIYVLAD